jgi:hypothetical protein
MIPQTSSQDLLRVMWYTFFPEIKVLLRAEELRHLPAIILLFNGVTILTGLPIFIRIFTSGFEIESNTDRTTPIEDFCGKTKSTLTQCSVHSGRFAKRTMSSVTDKLRFMLFYSIGHKAEGAMAVLDVEMRIEAWTANNARPSICENRFIKCRC